MFVCVRQTAETAVSQDGDCLLFKHTHTITTNSPLVKDKCHFFVVVPRLRQGLSLLAFFLFALFLLYFHGCVGLNQQTAHRQAKAETGLSFSANSFCRFSRWWWWWWWRWWWWFTRANTKHMMDFKIEGIPPKTQTPPPLPRLAALQLGQFWFVFKFGLKFVHKQVFNYHQSRYQTPQPPAQSSIERLVASWSATTTINKFKPFSSEIGRLLAAFTQKHTQARHPSSSSSPSAPTSSIGLLIKD